MAENLARLQRSVRSRLADEWQPASSALGKLALRSRPARKYLLSLTTERNSYLRQRSIPGLGELAQDDPEILATISQLIRDPNPQVIQPAAQALGALSQNHPSQVLGLITQLAEAEDDRVRAAAAVALGYALNSQPKACFHLLGRLAEDASGSVRAVAAQSLGKAGDSRSKKALKILAELAMCDDQYLHQGAAQALAELAEQPPPGLIKLLRQLALHQSESGRWCAVTALSGCKPPLGPALRGLLRRLAQDPSPSIRSRLAISLAVLGKRGEPATFPLLKELIGDRDRFVRSTAAEALGTVALGLPKDSLALLEQISADDDDYLRLGATVAWGLAGRASPEKAIAHLQSLSKDNWHRVRASGASSLGQLAPHLPREALQALKPLIEDKEAVVRELALQSLGRLVDTDPEYALSAISQSTDDAHPAVRRAAACAVIELAAKAPDRVFRVLGNLATDLFVSSATADGLSEVINAEPPQVLLRLSRLIEQAPDPSLLTEIAPKVSAPKTGQLIATWQLLLTTDDLESALADLLPLLRQHRQARGGRELHRTFLLFHRILSVKSADDLATAVSGRQKLTPVSGLISNALVEVISILARASRLVARAERAETPQLRTQDLVSALSLVEDGGQVRQACSHPVEQRLARQALLIWRTILSATINTLQARAELRARLISKEAIGRPQVSVGIEVENQGRATAQEVAIILHHLQNGQVVEGTAQVPWLEQNERAQVELKIAPQPGSKIIKLPIEIKFRDPEQKQKSISFSETMILRAPKKRFRRLPNPYVPGKPLEPDSKMFFGRREVFELLRHNFGGTRQQNIVALTGQRRTGKTSILKRLGQELGDRYVPVFVDVQGMLVDNLPLFFYRLASRVAAALQDAGLKADLPSLEQLRERPDWEFQPAFFREAVKSAGQRHVLIILDEFDDLETKVRSGLLPDAVFTYLRHIMQHSPEIAFLLSGTHRVEELGKEYWSFLFNLALYQKVGPLEEDACRQLIWQPLDQLAVICDDLARERIVALTGRHPYFLQLAGHYLVNQCNQERKNYLIPEDISRAVAELVRWGDLHLRYLWDLATSIERAVLAAVQYQLQTSGMANLEEVGKVLRDYGLSLRRPQLIRAIEGLLEKEILEEYGTQIPRYRFSMGLFQHWVSVHQPAARAIAGAANQVHQGDNR